MVANILIVVVVIVIILFFVFRGVVVDGEVAECIGKNAIVYTQVGCHACETQEAMFGENYTLLTSVDCSEEPLKCQDISGTPTWEINGEFYKGVQAIERLKELTGC